MRPRGRERGAEVVFRRHVVDRVVDQHGVERLAEADRAHVADVMGDAGIQAAGVREHGFGEVHRRGLEVAGEMVEEVAAAGAEFQEAPPAGAETGAEFALGGRPRPRSPPAGSSAARGARGRRRGGGRRASAGQRTAVVEGTEVGLRRAQRASCCESAVVRGWPTARLAPPAWNAGFSRHSPPKAGGGTNLTRRGRLRVRPPGLATNRPRPSGPLCRLKPAVQAGGGALERLGRGGNRTRSAARAG